MTFRLNNGFGTSETPLETEPDIPTVSDIQDIVAAMFQSGAHDKVMVVYNPQTRTISLSVAGIVGAPINAPPVLMQIPPQTLAVGSPYSFSLSSYASDPDGDTLSYGISGATPPGIVQSGPLFSGTPTAAGSYITIVTISDPDGLTHSGVIEWLVEASTASISPAPGGVSVRIFGEFPDFTIIPAVGGIKVEAA